MINTGRYALRSFWCFGRRKGSGSSGSSNSRLPFYKRHNSESVQNFGEPFSLVIHEKRHNSESLISTRILLCAAGPELWGTILPANS
ncbi:hypothetical protein L1987_45423 [Smallanthus sonchifolius]|uniref:Uncharacterized protein n=1 Tax=Smallanthus sonchifolius TaxID=185202 RepID=A0ACB9FWB3_9ASTR|nr:hypothetical protein L1987_45423 [Smallanthus sonchifolius]